MRRWLLVTACSHRLFQPGQDLEKRTPWTPRSSIFKKIFRKICQIFRQIWILERENYKNFINIISIACKWSKIRKYYVNSMVISCSTWQKKEKEWMWVLYLIYAVFAQFQICHILSVFSAKSVFLKYQSSQKTVFFPSLAWPCSSKASLVRTILPQPSLHKEHRQNNPNYPVWIYKEI